MASPLPPVLAGPILRRVDWNSVSVWIALSKAAQVELTLFKGIAVDANPIATHFVMPQNVTPLVSTTAPTLRIGANLHIALVTVIPFGTATLEPNQVYSYQIRLDADDDLKSLGLLEDNDDDPAHPRLALGYEKGALPSFVAPPEEVEELVLLHGSCRKVHGPDRDAMAYIDAIIDDARGTPRRPHQLFLTGDQIYADDIPSALLRELTETGAALLGVTERVHVGGSTVHPVTVANFPPGRRQTLMTKTAQLSSTDAGSHLISFGEFCAAHLFAWSNAVWPDTLESKQVVLDQSGAAPPTDALLAAFDSDEFERAEDEFEDEIKALRQYRRHLPRIRRALANVPVLMIFDDHEITDDWNLTGEWWSRVIDSTNVLGRTIIFNGLAAYTLFQGWGNDPEYYAQSPASDLLTDISGFFATDPGPDASAFSAFIQKIESSPPVLRWHYTVERPKYRFIVLDTRTRRSYERAVGPPGLLSAEALEEQIPPWLHPVDATIIISAAPVLGLPAMESALSSYVDDYRKSDPETDEAPLLEKDLEAWAFDIAAFERLMARLYDLQSVVLLGGDVHYAFSTAMTYWKAGTNPRRFAQLTSSALKNPSPYFIGLLKSALGTLFFDSFHRSEAMLGWNAPVTLTQPLGWFDGDLKSRLAQSPVMLPEGSEVSLDRPSDWSWRIELQRDTRPDDGSAGSRPTFAALVPLKQDFEFSVQTSGSFYGGTLTVHAGRVRSRTPRAVVWHSSVGQVTFERDLNQELSVRHAIIYLNPDGLQPGTPQQWVHHPIRIGAVTDPNAPALGNP